MKIDLPLDPENMKNTHLSIDLDYWTTEEWGASHEDLDYVCRQLIKRQIPTNVIRYHQRAIKYISKNCTELINVDQHSDYPKEITKLNCGTWASPKFLPFICSYTWYYQKNGESCDEGSWRSHKLEFKKFRIKKVAWLSRSLPWDKICECTICLSPDFSRDREMYEKMRKKVTKLFGKIN